MVRLSNLKQESHVMRVLIVEDNLDIQANIADYLDGSYTLDFAYNGTHGLELALNNEYDVLVFDVMLPGLDGFEICRRYKFNAAIQAPILMLTARDTIDDKDEGFTAGADDYLVKPFALRELKMRIDALSRRPKTRHSKNITYGDIILNLQIPELTISGKTIAIHAREATIFALLIEECPEIVTGEAISYKLWADEPPESGALRTHIYNLRKLLTKLGHKDKLTTVRGRGYKLEGIE